jgi:hypothetical protein
MIIIVSASLRAADLCIGKPLAAGSGLLDQRSRSACMDSVNAAST